MTVKSNLHTHTTFCDGKSSPEETVLKAIELGFESIGFSAHAYTPCEPQYSMKKEDTPLYRREIFRLRDKYRDKIQVYLGLELDIYSEKPDFPCDYLIGSLHYIKCGDEYIAVDDTPEKARAMVNSYFGGDWYAYAERYYSDMSRTAELTGCDIVGHFDLPTKFNEGGACFDETSPRYRRAALEALRETVKTCPLLEINTGAMSRKRRTVPYPAAFILRELKALGGEVVISSDSHRADTLDYGFGDALELARSCGFRYVKVLRDGAFTNVKI